MNYQSLQHIWSSLAKIHQHILQKHGSIDPQAKALSGEIFRLMKKVQRLLLKEEKKLKQKKDDS